MNKELNIIKVIYLEKIICSEQTLKKIISAKLSLKYFYFNFVKAYLNTQNL